MPAREAAPTVLLPDAVRRAIVRHAARERPRECCGFLLGSGRAVAFAVAMPNVARGTTRFVIDPAAHIGMRRLVRRFAPALSIVGTYHSHPASPPVPSPRDIREAMYPEWVYVIAGPEGRRPRVRAFRIRRNRVRELSILRSEKRGGAKRKGGRV